MKRVFFPVAILFFALNAGGQPSVKTGADQLTRVIHVIGHDRVALLVNHTAKVGNAHLVDTLMRHGVKVVSILAPEHGFRGTADAGEIIKDGLDSRSGLPVISLYGSHKKPTPEQLQNVDAVIFDIQDVGARFFTYISSLHYLMEACAEQNKRVIVLDRPNPNGYVDGPVLQKELTSFIGMHPIPIAHGLTVGEIARMINGEGWLQNGVRCKLDVVPLQHWKHSDGYAVPVRPSPNLPNNNAIGWYTSTCLFEGTVLSVGRGTQHPFEWIGHPQLTPYAFSFTPQSIEGMSKQPPYENIPCFGLNLIDSVPPRGVTLKHLIRLYRDYPEKEKFFIPFFDKLAGTADLRQQIEAGMSEEDIRATWQPALQTYRTVRKKYLLYP
ncbi:MAG: DUF1343 domain-containing protein [Cyclobacteriaceae bacterium]|jgi:uncharacterized protein YbbC (DUF1343 family)|nr:DUF1343 domain-containing protein [Cyclobacteriaceae bacterium]